MLTAVVVILCVILLGIVLLSVPVEIDFAIQNDPQPGHDIAVVWFFGLLRTPLRTPSSKKAIEQTVKNSAPQPKRRRRGKAIALMRNADLRRRCLLYLRRLVRAIELKALDVQVRLGLDDPADTGRLWGIVGPLAAIIAGWRGANVRIVPEFAGQVFSLQSRGSIRIIPLQILMIGLLFFISPQMIRWLASKS